MDVLQTQQQAQSAYQQREANPGQAVSDLRGSVVGGALESAYKGSYLEGLVDRFRGMSPRDQFIQNVRYGHVSPTDADIEKYGLTSDDLVQNQVNSGKAQNIAHNVGGFAGGMVPWLAAGAATGGAADALGVGAEAIEGAPLLTRLAAALGRGAVQGAGVTGWEALTGNKPTSKELLQNMAYGGAADIAGTAAGAAGQALKLPAVITRPVGAFVGGTAGALAGGQPSPLRQGATLGAVEAALTALGGRGAFMPSTTPEVEGESPQTPPQAETIPGMAEPAALEAQAAPEATTPLPLDEFMRQIKRSGGGYMLPDGSTVSRQDLGGYPSFDRDEAEWVYNTIYLPKFASTAPNVAPEATPTEVTPQAGTITPEATVTPETANGEAVVQAEVTPPANAADLRKLAISTATAKEFAQAVLGNDVDTKDPSYKMMTGMWKTVNDEATKANAVVEPATPTQEPSTPVQPAPYKKQDEQAPPERTTPVKGEYGERVEIKTQVGKGEYEWQPGMIVESMATSAGGRAFSVLPDDSERGDTVRVYEQDIRSRPGATAAQDLPQEQSPAPVTEAPASPEYDADRAYQAQVKTTEPSAEEAKLKQLLPYEQSKVPKSIANVLFTGGRMISGTVDGRQFISDRYAAMPVTPEDMAAVEAKTNYIADYGDRIGKIIPKKATTDIGEPIGKDFSEGTDSVLFDIERNGLQLALNQRYYDYFRSKGWDLKIDPKDSYDPAVAYDKDGNVQGIIMPIKVGREYTPAEKGQPYSLDHVKQLALRTDSTAFKKTIKKSVDWPKIKKMLDANKLTPEQFHDNAVAEQHPAVQSLDPTVKDPPIEHSVGADTWRPGEKMVNEDGGNYRLLKDDKKTSRDSRQELNGVINDQIIRGQQVTHYAANYLSPTKDNPAGEQEIAYIQRDTQNDKVAMQKILDMPDERIQKKLDAMMPDGSKLTYRQGLEGMIKGLSGRGVQGEGIINDLVQAIQDHSVKMGTIGRGQEDFQGIPDYINRIYKEPKPSDYVKTEIGKEGISSFTSHSMARKYASVIHAYLSLDENLDPIKDREGNVIPGREPKTMNLSKVANVLNEEMARVNAKMDYQNKQVDLGLAAWSRGNIPDGWEKTGLEKKHAVLDAEGKPVIDTRYFIQPKGIVKGMAAVLEPNFIKKVDALKGLQKYQGFIKTVDLSYSAFHHATMLAQMLYQSKGGLDILMNYPRFRSLVESGGFNAVVQDFARHGGMIESLSENMDAMRKMTEGDDLLAKFANAPGAKQFFQGAEISRNFLFDKMQTYLKTMDYSNKIGRYMSGHPDISDEDLVLAKRGIAREVNNAYGGLNWQALGVTPSVRSMLRMTLLAPDWTVSNYALFVDATGNWKGPENATAGGAARSHIATALIAGGILTEGLNYVLTGHYTDKNPKGHETEVEISPGVYVSLFRGGIGDILKFVSDTARYGPQGAAMFAQSKLSPLFRTATGLLSNTDQMGRKISSSTNSFAQNSASVGTFLADNAMPVPFGGSELSQYLFADKGPVAGIEQYARTGQLPNKRITPEGIATVGSGLGTFAPPPNKGTVFDVPQADYKGNLINEAENAFNPQQSGMQDLTASMSAENKAHLAENTALEEEIGKAIVNNDQDAIPGIFKKYGTPQAQQKTMLDNVKTKLDKRSVEDYPYNYDVAQSLTDFYNNMDTMQTAAISKDMTGFSAPLLTYFTRQAKSLTAARNMLQKIDGNQKLTAAEKAQMEQNYQTLMQKIADASNRHYDKWEAGQ
jgi:hypothetical protein